MKQNKWVLVFFLFPSVVFFLMAVVIPFFMGINIAFTDWDGIAVDYEYVGFENFIRLFSDTSIVDPIINTLIYAVGYTAINNICSLALAVLLSTYIKGKAILKTIFFVPMALSAVLAAFVWGFIYKDVVSELLGIDSLLGNPDTVILGIIIMALWNTLGSNLIIYMAGLDNIPEMYNEAAEIDGASPARRFLHITVPLLMPSFTICITLQFTSALREFATVMSATGGGPAGSSETIAIFIYQNLFSFFKASYGQAASLVFLVVLVVIGALLSSFFRKREVEY